MAELLSSGETVRAEEIALRVPDGRSVRVLLNATPIQSEEGVLTSFVVTLQDLTSLEEAVSRFLAGGGNHPPGGGTGGGPVPGAGRQAAHPAGAGQPTPPRGRPSW